MFNNNNRNSKGESKTILPSSNVNIIGSGTSIQGDIVCEGDIRIDGQVNGLVSTKAKIVVGPEGEISVRATGDLRLNDDDALAEAVLGGLGIALLPTFIIGKDIQAGRLQVVLSDYVPLEQHVYALYLPNRHLSAKVRAFIDFFAERIGPEPYWDRVEPGASSAGGMPLMQGRVTSS